MNRNCLPVINQLSGIGCAFDPSNIMPSRTRDKSHMTLAAAVHFICGFVNTQTDLYLLHTNRSADIGEFGASRVPSALYTRQLRSTSSLQTMRLVFLTPSSLCGSNSFLRVFTMSSLANIRRNASAPLRRLHDQLDLHIGVE